MRALVVIACLFLAGCGATVPAIAPSGNVDRLLVHAQFKAAAQAAPDFTVEALNTIARLEHDLVK